jgi:MFS family permease
MAIIALAQIQLGFNVNALAISMGAIVDEFDASAATVGTALVIYSLAVAGTVMLGARVGEIIGSRRAFQVGIGAQGAAMVVMALSTGPEIMFAAQFVAGVAAALAVPAFVVLIAAHYRARQQEQSLGLLGAAQASSAALAFMVVGTLSVVVSWRWSFAMLAVLAVVIVVLSFRMQPIDPIPEVRIDWIGALLAASAITLISLGFNSVNAWGLLVANEDAPFEVLGLSPVPLFVIVGVVLGQAFFAWLRRRQAHNKPQLFALEVLDTREERAATFSLLIIAGLGPAVNFLIPLYIQIVQGRSVAQTMIAIVPYSVAIFIGTIFVVRLFDRFTPRHIGRVGFIAVAAGLFLLAFAIDNDWGDPFVILSLIIVGLGEGALLTLVFNVLVSASPKELAGHVGALRGTVNNLATGLGTAVASVLAIIALTILISGNLVDSPTIPAEFYEDLELDDVDFISNEDLEVALEGTDAPPEIADELVRINSEARLTALKISFQVLAGLALLGIFPAGGLPPYLPGEVPEPGSLRHDEVHRTTRDRVTSFARTPARRRRARKQKGAAAP